MQQRPYETVPTEDIENANGVMPPQRSAREELKLMYIRQQHEQYGEYPGWYHRAHEASLDFLDRAVEAYPNKSWTEILDAVTEHPAMKEWLTERNAETVAARQRI